MPSHMPTALGAIAVAAGVHAQTVFTDTEFFVEDWEHVILMSEGDVVLGPFTQEQVGGNPGRFQLGFHQTDGPFAAIYDGHAFLDAMYSPSQDGAIDAVDISYDWIDLDRGGVQHGLAVFQGNESYIRFVDSSGPHERWTTLSLDGVDEDDPQWQRVTEAGIFQDGPDFSGEGEDITFGYYAFNWSLPQGFLIQRTWGIDNFTIVVNGECPPDCTGDGELDILDFLCFQQAWEDQLPNGDCNDDGRYDILDFVCFQGLFVNGCR